jgi:hypothetical protein
VKVSPEEVVAALRRAGSDPAAGGVADKYYLCTAQRESGFETSAEVVEGNGTVSRGLYQIRGGSLDLDENTRQMVILTESNRASIMQAAGARREPWDMGAYLSIAHNQGLGAALETIAEYGMDFLAYAERNAEISKPGFDGARIVERGWACNYGSPAGLGTLIVGAAGLALAAGIAWGAR